MPPPQNVPARSDDDRSLVTAATGAPCGRPPRAPTSPRSEPPPPRQSRAPYLQTSPVRLFTASIRTVSCPCTRSTKRLTSRQRTIRRDRPHRGRGPEGVPDRWTSFDRRSRLRQQFAKCLGLTFPNIDYLGVDVTPELLATRTSRRVAQMCLLVHEVLRGDGDVRRLEFGVAHRTRPDRKRADAEERHHGEFRPTRWNGCSRKPNAPATARQHFRPAGH